MQLLAATYFALTYSVGIPLLIPVVAVFFFVMYWVDKWLFCKAYQTPPQYSWHLAARAGAILPFAGLLHFGFGMWMLGNQDIIPPNNILQGSSSAASSSYSTALTTALTWADGIDPTSVGVSQRVQSSHVLPMFVALFVLFCILALSRLVRPVAR